MAQDIGEQINTIERALGERMIEHALVILRAWLNELGENNPYESAFQSIRRQYVELFQTWLSVDEDGADETLNKLTGDTYQLVDAVYVDIRLLRGMSPQMHGFKADNPQSVINYFANCVRLTLEDLDWLREVAQDSERKGVALLAVSALVKNLRECFSIEAFLALIDCTNAQTQLVAEQAIACVCTLFIHYDVRIDFFPQIEDAFVKAIEVMDDGGERVFEIICSLIQSAPTIRKWMPDTEREYIEGLMQIFPDTWLYKVVVDGVASRESAIALVYLAIGNMDLAWTYPDLAEEWLVKRLRKGSKEVRDYINYAHCLMLKGDRIMAYEYYHQARQLCASAKEFFALFRPDRKALVDHGIPIEQVYLMEDQLLVV